MVARRRGQVRSATSRAGRLRPAPSGDEDSDAAMVSRTSRRAGRGPRRGRGGAFVAATFVAAGFVAAVRTFVCAAPGRAVAAEDETPPQLWEPDQAVAFLLGAPGSAQGAG